MINGAKKCTCVLVRTLSYQPRPAINPRASTTIEATMQRRHRKVRPRHPVNKAAVECLIATVDASELQSPQTGVDHEDDAA
jgi:hypothetical protein